MRGAAAGQRGLLPSVRVAGPLLVVTREHRARDDALMAEFIRRTGCTEDEGLTFGNQVRAAP